MYPFIFFIKKYLKYSFFSNLFKIIYLILHSLNVLKTLSYEKVEIDMYDGCGSGNVM